MNVVVIGSGGREYALAQKISESNKLRKLFIIPGNPGTKMIGKNVEINVDDKNVILNFCKEQEIDLVVIGPEKPLTEGLSDLLRSNKINVFGPSKSAARIEGEKSFAKSLMSEAGIPTADFKVFDKTEYGNALRYLFQINYPIVIKADGIAGGKGVIIAEDYNLAKAAIEDCFIYSSFGNAGDKVVIEEFMTGQEASVFAITDGEKYYLLPAAQDHKRIFDNDEGKNTGGMGAYAPTPFVNQDDMQKVAELIVEPTLKAMREIKNTFNGCLYVGLMMTAEGPKVVEYNCRFGDPETQVVLNLLNGDFLELLYSTAIGKINTDAVYYNGGSSVSVVVASGGYPDRYDTGFAISGLDDISENVKIFHAGTKELNGKIVTNGGRVLNITSFCEKSDLRYAKKIAYDAIKKIHFDKMHYRKDISDKALR